MKPLFLLFASPLAIASEPTLAPYFQLSGHRDAQSVLPLESTHASVSIAGTIAQVELTQTYTNEGAVPIDASYLFPASTRAAVHGMTMTIGDRTITAEIQEKTEAKKTFAKAKSENKSASLLEQQRPNLFQMSVARILPGDEITVVLNYSEMLIPEDNIYQFVLPTTFGPRYSQGGAPEPTQPVPNPFLTEGLPSPASFTVDLSLSSGLPIQSVDSPSHQLTVDYSSANSAKLSWRGQPRDPGNNRDLIINYQLVDHAIESGILLHRDKKENFLNITVQPPERVTPANIPPRDYLFVIDVSGSMGGFPLDTSKELIKNLARKLRPIDTFNLLFFAGSSQTLFQEPKPATRENVEDALNFLSSQQGGGGTELTAALRKALKQKQAREGSRSILVITDGFIDFEAKTFDLIRRNLSRANLFAFGIGSSVNRHLIEGMAVAGDGEPFIVTKPSEAERVSQQFCEAISSPILTDIKIETQGCQISAWEPNKPRDLFANRPLSINAKWSGRPQGQITISGLTGNGQRWKQTLDLAEAAEKNGLQQPALRPLWARERVRRLADYAGLTKDHDLIGEVTNLGLTYSILSPWTSFVAVDTISRPTDQEPQLAHQPNPLPQGVSNAAMPSSSITSSGAAAVVTNGSVPEPSTVSLIFITLLSITLHRRR
ncbi:MAG: VIT domain-containing protein [Verrucomicrobiota bacterium JB023]|nr:VIT domain-containing protein [Verrucomicrobiota bacterium JB023]